MSNNKRIDERNSKKDKNRRVTPIYIILGVYLLLAVIVMVIFAPSAFSGMGYWLELLKPEFVIVIFIIALVFSLIIIYLLYRVYSKEKSRRVIEKQDINIEKLQYYGRYDDERKYLENKLNEFSDRLMSTEKKWIDINHLILSSNDKNSANVDASSNSFLHRYGIDMSNIIVVNNLVFVLTPFSETFIDDYETIKEACTEQYLESIRGDENYYEDIFPQIIKTMAKSKIVVANINGRNPNVFYELGIAHMMNKPTIIVCRSKDDLIVDLQHKFVVFYRNKEELFNGLVDMLKKILTY